ncbi:MAG: hypothetical protein HOO95_00875 [Gallionella sp.]|nr:hypothetical protein [Gallionella sp.]
MCAAAFWRVEETKEFAKFWRDEAARERGAACLRRALICDEYAEFFEDRLRRMGVEVEE